jgi:hypothetical protein
MKSKHRNLAAKATLVFNMYIDTDLEGIKEFRKKINNSGDRPDFYDFSLDHQKIKELKILRAVKKG